MWKCFIKSKKMLWCLKFFAEMKIRNFYGYQKRNLRENSKQPVGNYLYFRENFYQNKTKIPKFYKIIFKNIYGA